MKQKIIKLIKLTCLLSILFCATHCGNPFQDVIDFFSGSNEEDPYSFSSENEVKSYYMVHSVLHHLMSLIESENGPFGGNSDTQDENDDCDLFGSFTVDATSLVFSNCTTESDDETTFVDGSITLDEEISPSTWAVDYELSVETESAAYDYVVLGTLTYENSITNIDIEGVIDEMSILLGGALTYNDDSTFSDSITILIDEAETTCSFDHFGPGDKSKFNESCGFMVY